MTKSEITKIYDSDNFIKNEYLIQFFLRILHHKSVRGYEDNRRHELILFTSIKLVLSIRL